MITIGGHWLLHKTLLFHENPEQEQILCLSAFPPYATLIPSWSHIAECNKLNIMKDIISIALSFITGSQMWHNTLPGPAPPT